MVPNSSIICCEHRLDLVLLGDVGLDGRRPRRPRLGSPRHDLLGRLGLADVVDDHVGAGLAEGDGHALADAGVGAGDQRLLARPASCGPRSSASRPAADPLWSSFLRISGVLGLRLRGRAAARLQELGDQPGPAGLVRGADAAAVVAVEVFVEQQVVAEVRIVLQLCRASPNTGRRPVLVAQEDAASGAATAPRRPARG